MFKKIFFYSIIYAQLREMQQKSQERIQDVLRL
jgi:hypothetical protein